MAGGGSSDVGFFQRAAATSAAQREWRRLGARTPTEARAHYLEYIRRLWGFAAARAHAKLRLSRLELLGHRGRIATRHSATATVVMASAAVFHEGHRPMSGGGGRAGRMGGGAL